jgi:hypothetical protein
METPRIPDGTWTLLLKHKIIPESRYTERCSNLKRSLLLTVPY